MHRDLSGRCVPHRDSLQSVEMGRSAGWLFPIGGRGWMRSESRSALLFCACLLALFHSNESRAQSIGVYFDPQGTYCDANMQPFTPFTACVLAKLGGFPAHGEVKSAPPTAPSWNYPPSDRHPPPQPGPT